MRRLLGQIWFDVRRLHLEHRSRVRFVTGLLALVAVAGLCLIWMLPPVAMAGILPVVLLVVIRVVVNVLQLRARGGDPLSVLSIVSDEPIPAELEQNLGRHLVALAALIHRASSELMMASQDLMPGIEVVTRKRILDRLREIDAWDAIGPDARSLLMRPDGAWTTHEAYSVLFYFEFLRCLAWVLGYERHLAPLSSGPRPDYSLAGEIVFGRLKPGRRPTQRAIAGHAMVAVGYFYRARYELGTRSSGEVAFEPQDREVAGAYLLKGYREGYADVYDSDFPVGGRVMHELDADSLWQAERTSRQRALLLGGVAEAAMGATQEWKLWEWLAEAEGARLMAEVEHIAEVARTRTPAPLQPAAAIPSAARFRQAK